MGHQVTTTSTSIDELGGSDALSISGGVDFIAEGTVTNTVTVSYKHTWQSSKSQQITDTSSVSSDCSIDLPAGHKALANATMNVGTLKGNLIMTVLEDDKCVPAQKSQHIANVEVSNVPMTQAYSSCTWQNEACESVEKAVLI